MPCERHDGGVKMTGRLSSSTRSSEPGTFKDRELLLHFPHLIIEGLLLAAIVTEASQGFIYIRHEYPEQIAACEKEIARAFPRDGPLGDGIGRPFKVAVFVSPGGYICGEQGAHRSDVGSPGRTAKPPAKTRNQRPG